MCLFYKDNNTIGGGQGLVLVENISRVPFKGIKLDNHLDNGGSFTLNANKTITVLVTKQSGYVTVGSSDGNLRCDGTILGLGVSGSYGISGSNHGDSYLWVSVNFSSAFPSRIDNDESWKFYFGNVAINAESLIWHSTKDFSASFTLDYAGQHGISANSFHSSCGFYYSSEHYDAEYLLNKIEYS